MEKIRLRAPKYGMYDFSWMPKEIFPLDQNPESAIEVFIDPTYGIFTWCRYTMEEIDNPEIYNKQWRDKVKEIRERTRKSHPVKYLAQSIWKFLKRKGA